MTIKLKTRKWDDVENLETEKYMAAYLEAGLENGDLELRRAALGDIASAKGMYFGDTDLDCEGLSKALPRDGDLVCATALAVR
jgi:probable addiction module antidote protein